jgi:hypothetical protein
LPSGKTPIPDIGILKEGKAECANPELEGLQQMELLVPRATQP